MELVPLKSGGGRHQLFLQAAELVFQSSDAAVEAFQYFPGFRRDGHAILAMMARGGAAFDGIIKFLAAGAASALALLMMVPALAVIIALRPMIRGALASDAFYVGWIGSHRNQERRRGLLRDDGMTDDELARISGPTGLDIGAATPAETAVSILGEIIAARSGRDGGRLKDAKSRIHASL